jgi:predicted RNA binding protein YcfA (HicA-like mRNA interferase family)
MNDSQKIVSRLKKEGWVEVSRKGSHTTFKKDGVEHLITIPHPRKDLPRGLSRAIEKAAGWR